MGRRVGVLEKCMYGPEDAAQGWEGAYQQAVRRMGARRMGRSIPCVFRHARLQVSFIVHGDGFFSIGRPDALDKFEASRAAAFEGGVKGRSGAMWKSHSQSRTPPDRGGQRVRGGSASHGVARRRFARVDAGREEARGKGMWGGGLRAGRRPREPLASGSRELLRKRPLRHNVQGAVALWGLSRFLLGKPRVVWHYGGQKKPNILDIKFDSDWAGCAKTSNSCDAGGFVEASYGRIIEYP